MVGTPGPGSGTPLAVAPPPAELLKKFYRSFHKHGASNWPKIAKDAKMTVEACEALHKQHTSFLSLPAKPDLEAAFVAMVVDHFNATQKMALEAQEEEEPSGGRGGRRGAAAETDDEEDEAGHVTASSSQKSRRTPKATRERFAADEDLPGRRQGTPSRKPGLATPQSARAKAAAKATSSPVAEWASPSGRKRSRKLFEDNVEAAQEPRFRSPVVDRWRGRLNNDVDEGVDALLSLASGAHASTNLDEPGPAVATATTADVDDAEAALMGPIGTPKRARGGRGGRGTPSGTPMASPMKGLGRGASGAEAGALPQSPALRSPSKGLRNTPLARSGRAGTSGRKDSRQSPASSSQLQGEDDEAGSGEGDQDDGSDAAGTRGLSASDGGVNGGGMHRPRRQRKPSAIAVAAAITTLQEAEEAMAGGRAKGPAAAAAAAAAAVLDAAQAATGRIKEEEEDEDGEPGPSGMEDGERGLGAGPLESSGAGGMGSQDLAQSTAALLATVAPVKTRSGRAGRRGVPGSPLVERGLPAPASQSFLADKEGKERSSSGVVPLSAVRTGSLGPGPQQPPPPRARRRKALPERLPLGATPLKMLVAKSGPYAAEGWLGNYEGLNTLAAAGFGVNSQPAGALPVAIQGMVPGLLSPGGTTHQQFLPGLEGFQQMLAAMQSGAAPAEGAAQEAAGADGAAAAGGAAAAAAPVVPSADAAPGAADALAPADEGKPSSAEGAPAAGPAAEAADAAGSGEPAGPAPAAAAPAAGAAAAAPGALLPGAGLSGIPGMPALVGLPGMHGLSSLSSLAGMPGLSGLAGLQGLSMPLPGMLMPRPVMVGEDGQPLPLAEVALRHCLSNPRTRRWCMFEFHYAALDRPWFLRNELLEFCMHMQLPTTKLTRLEWSVLRSSLGKPRRLSLSFLKEERMRLEGYREHVRLKYEEVGLGMEVPPELPRPLRVGQQVTARHPVTRQLHDGQVLTVKGSKYRVQFSRSELMTEVVRDTEVMPREPHDCLPLHMAVVPALLNGRCHEAGGARVGPRGVAAAAAARPFGVLPMLGTWASGLENQLMREADANLVAELQRGLETKEGLVCRLSHLNNEAQGGMHRDAQGEQTEAFQMQYSNVVLQLKEANAAIESAMVRLQSRQQQVLCTGAAASSVSAMLAMQQQQQQAARSMAAAGGAPGAAGPGGDAAAGVAGLLPLPAAPGGGAGAAEGSGDGAALAPARSSAPEDAAAAAGLPGQGGPVAASPLRSGQAGPVGSAQEVVEQAMAEARAVTDAYRGKNAPQKPQPAPGAAGPEAQAVAAGAPAVKQEQEAGADTGAEAAPAPAAPTGAAAPASSAAGEEDATERGLRDVIVGCVGVLLTLQRCTAGGVPPATVAEALDRAVAALQPRAPGNEGVYKDILSSVQGLKAHLTQAS